MLREFLVYSHQPNVLGMIKKQLERHEVFFPLELLVRAAVAALNIECCGQDIDRLSISEIVNCGIKETIRDTQMENLLYSSKLETMDNVSQFVSGCVSLILTGLCAELIDMEVDRSTIVEIKYMTSKDHCVVYSAKQQKRKNYAI